MNLTAWLERALDFCALSEEGRDYLMGRGATPETIERWGIKVFDAAPEPFPDERVHEYYGPHFERFEGKLVFPLYNPSGRLIGIDTRSINAKDDDRYLLPEARWNPIWIGMPMAMDAVYEGREVIVVEGRYDVFPLYHVAEGRAVIGSGTAHLSWKQLEFLRRWAGRVGREKGGGHVYLAYDRDNAGKVGVEDGLRDLAKRRVKCSELKYGTPGDDPGTIWDRGGVAAMPEAFFFGQG